MKTFIHSVLRDTGSAISSGQSRDAMTGLRRRETETACCRANATPVELNITVTVEQSNDLINRSTVCSDASV